MQTYPQVLEYLYTQLPMFHRVGAVAYKADLSNTLRLCSLLGDPHTKLRCIHIAGTNGKGSTSHMLASVLQAAGYKVGLYTSPHLKDFRERIRINGKMIPKKKVVDFVQQYREPFEEIAPSFFEWTVALAFQYFEAERVDVAVIETGLGGRLDSTNVIHPDLSIITNIGFDHMSLLGNTLAQIAHEKAGIIKKKVPIIITEYQEEITEVFLQKAREQEAELSYATLVWEHEQVKADADYLSADFKQQGKLRYAQLQLDLQGNYQLKNVKGVLQAVDRLNQQGFSISEQELRRGLRAVKKKTGLQGRWQVLQNDPLLICDTGHNKPGIQEVLLQIEKVAYKQLHWVLGMVNDKDISGVLELLPKNARYYFCRPDIPRGLAVQELNALAEGFGLKGTLHASVTAALDAAKAKAAKRDLILVAGSNFVVAEVL